MIDISAPSHRPRVHLMPPRAWMNEPHAPIQYAGRHHIFFQHNPREADWAQIGWGHSVSDDLLNWDYLGLALDPRTVPTAPDGVWSGSAVVGEDGQMLLYFTAGDFSRNPNQAVARARATDESGTAFEPDGGLLVQQPDRAPGWTESTISGEFRDPFVWRESGEWFMLVGSGVCDRGGAALLFSSPDGVEWHQEPPLLVGSTADWPATGVMWELPVLLPIGHGADGRPRHALFVAPWFDGSSEHHLQYVWHWVGVWDATERRFVPDSEAPQHFDYGGHLTGPSGTVLDDGRSILWTIAQDGRSRQEHLDSDWAHNAGLPIELSLGADGRLKVNPIHELVRLRSRTLVDLVDPSPDDAIAALASVRGLLLEVELEAKLGREPLSVQVRKSGAGEQTVVGIDPIGDTLWVDRSRSSLDPAHCAPLRSGPVRGGVAGLHLRVVVDGSMVEAWTNSVASITSRAYPIGDEADGIACSIPHDAKIHRLRVYALSPAPTLNNEKDERAATR